MKHSKLRTIFTILLTISLLFVIGLTAYADLDDDTGGDGGSGAEAGSWNDTMQGLRFTLTTMEGSPIMSKDILWSWPTSWDYAYYKNRFGSDAAGYDKLIGAFGTDYTKNLIKPLTGSNGSFSHNGGQLASYLLNMVDNPAIPGTKMPVLAPVVDDIFGKIGNKGAFETYIDNPETGVQGYVAIEPIFWYIPVRYSTGVAALGGQLYGTTRNIAEWNQANLNTDDGMANLSRKASPWSLHTGDNDGSQNGLGIEDPKMSLVNTMINNAEILSNRGYGLHLYWPKGDNGQTHTWDYPLDQTPGPAPEYKPEDDDGTTPGGEDPGGGGITQYPYIIIKFYAEDAPSPDDPEVILKNIPLGNYTREQNPAKIAIEDEGTEPTSFKVVDWFTSPTRKDPSNMDVVYEDHKATVSPQVQSGGGAGSVTLAQPTDKVLYMKLWRERKEETPPEPKDGEVTIEQSQISKAISTSRADIVKGWGTRTITYTHPAITCTEWHKCSGCMDGEDEDEDKDDCPGHSCTVTLSDANFTHGFKRTESPDTTIEGNSGVLAPKLIPPNVSGSRGGISAYTKTISSYVYDSTIHRAGPDKPTMVAYPDNTNSPSNNDSAINSALSLTRKNISAKTRLTANNDYNKDITITFGDASTDKNTSGLATWAYGSHTVTVTSNSGTGWNPYKAKVLVKVYRGATSPKTGNTIVNTNPYLLPMRLPDGATTLTKYGGRMIKIGDLKFDPYVRMTWQGTQTYDPTRNEVIVLSENIQTVSANAYIEAGWYQPQEGVNALHLTSNQWSGAARAIQGNEVWQDVNQVLPGGAIYQVDTKGSGLKYKVATWQPILHTDSAVQTAMTEAGSSGGLTLSDANSRFDAYVDSAKKAITSYRVVQWVNKNFNTTFAWNTGGVKILSPTTNISALYDGAQLNPDTKYILKAAGGAASTPSIEGDLDVGTGEPEERYFKVYSDIKGNVYVATANTSSAIANATGTLVASRTQNENSITLPTADIKELEAKTKIISNYIKAIERNAGADTSDAFGAGLGGKWYNEAWPGLIVQYKAMTFDVGLLDPELRSAAGDPALGPPNADGQAGLYTNAHLSQFRVNEAPEDSTLPSTADRYIGTFTPPTGSPVHMTMQEIELSLQSKQFYLPNASVQDLS